MTTSLVSDFFSFRKPEYSYILGFLWADGHLNSNKKLVLEINENDAQELLPIINLVGNWSVYKRNGRKPGWQRTWQFYITSRKLCDFLYTYDFNLKSSISPHKFLFDIPIEFRYLFFRGWFDGDGCWYCKNFVRQFVLSGPEKYDWHILTGLFDSLDMKYKLRYKINKYGKASAIEVWNRKSLINLGNYIYQDNISISLKRKYQKFIEIKNSYKYASPTYYEE